MSAAIGAEAGFWLYAAALGGLLLFLYDLLRIFRRVVPQSKWAVGVEDLLYWLVSALLIFAMLYRFNNGIIRWFAVFGMLVGMLLYHLTVSDVFVRYTSGAIRRVMRLLARVFVPPLRFLKDKIRRVASGICKKHKNVTISMKKKLKRDEKEGKIKPEKG